MSLVGIIANPAASKDIRRLVAQGRVVPDWEKVNLLRRVLAGLEGAGVHRVVAMPDGSHLVERAADGAHLLADPQLLDMTLRHTEEDTVRAAAMMESMGVSCLVTLGGDGTNRAVARGCSGIPLVAISTGTNNVFPVMVEGTLAGLAAGLVAQGRVNDGAALAVSKRIDVYLDGEYRDLALVDVAVSRERFVSTRAIWDLSTLYEVFLTRAELVGLGLSSVGAMLEGVSPADEWGLQYVLGGGSDGAATGGRGTEVLAPVAPGMVPWEPIASWRRVPLGETVPLERRHCTIALDGERAFAVTPQEQVEVVITRRGPVVVQVDAVLREAVSRGLFRR